MREVVENSPRVVGYSCLKGIKGRFKIKRMQVKRKRQLLSQGEFYVVKFDKLSAQTCKLLKNYLSFPHNNKNFPHCLITKTNCSMRPDGS